MREEVVLGGFMQALLLTGYARTPAHNERHRLGEEQQGRGLRRTRSRRRSSTQDVATNCVQPMAEVYVLIGLIAKGTEITENRARPSSSDCIGLDHSTPPFPAMPGVRWMDRRPRLAAVKEQSRSAAPPGAGRRAVGASAHAKPRRLMYCESLTQAHPSARQWSNRSPMHLLHQAHQAGSFSP